MAEEEKKAEAAKEEPADKKEEKKEGAEGETAAEEGEAGTEGGGKSKKKLIIIIVLLVVVLAGAGGGAFFFLNKSGGSAPEGEEGSGEEGVQLDEHGNPLPVFKDKVIYYDLEEFLVNLNSQGKRVGFLKMKITLELPGEKEKLAVESRLPRIRDTFQVYLRELRSSDLQGSAGIYRLREELLLRINQAIHPYKVNDILFKEIIVQ